MTEKTTSRFAKLVKVGETVLYWPSPTENPIFCAVRSEPWMIGGHTEVVQLSHRPGCFSTSHIASDNYIGEMVPVGGSNDKYAVRKLLELKRNET
jgi:hypothetical protein